MSLVTRSDQFSLNSKGYASKFGITLPSRYLLDKLELIHQAALAVGLVKLTQSYSGPLLRARRTSDNGTADIFPDRYGVVSMDSRAVGVSAGMGTGSLADFHAGGTCAVSAIYDQSPLRQKSVIVAPDKQPRFVIGGQFVTNDGSPPLIVYDGVDDETEWRFYRGLSHSIALAASHPGLGSNGAQPRSTSGSTAGFPANGAAEIFPALNGGSAASFAGKALQGGTDIRNRYRAVSAIFQSTQSALYIDADRAAVGDPGADPVVNLMLGRTAEGSFSNASFNAMVSLRGVPENPAALNTGIKTAYADAAALPPYAATTP